MVWDLACSSSALLEYMDTAVRSERDIWAFTKLPTLGGHRLHRRLVA